MSDERKPRRGGFLLFALFIIAAAGVLVALGTWQLERLSWKEGLIAELDAKLAAKPTDLPARERWQRLDAGVDQFRRDRMRLAVLIVGPDPCPGQVRLSLRGGRLTHGRLLNGEYGGE